MNMKEKNSKKEDNVRLDIKTKVLTCKTKMPKIYSLDDKKWQKCND